MEGQKEYYAFISYKHEDEKWLQYAWEYYRLPNNLRQEDPKLSEYIRRVFHNLGYRGDEEEDGVKEWYLNYK